MRVDQTHAKFGTTSWTLIEAAVEPQHPQHEQALTRLSERYWPAIYAHLRRRGMQPEAAAELTQAFFAEVVFGRRLFERARPGQGKLRTLLLTALQNYGIDQHRRRTARPEGASLSLDHLQDEEAFLAENVGESAATAFERRWAVAVLEEALARCEAYFEELDKESHWQVFHAYAILPALSGATPPPLSDLAGSLGFASAVHAASAMKVVRKRLRILLREVCADTARSHEEQDAEYDRVVQMLS
jgi:DNA-directed RNA polymerase specialized sigma24 family protein